MLPGYWVRPFQAGQQTSTAPLCIDAPGLSCPALPGKGEWTDPIPGHSHGIPGPGNATAGTGPAAPGREDRYNWEAQEKHQGRPAAVTVSHPAPGRGGGTPSLAALMVSPVRYLPGITGFDARDGKTMGPP